MQEAGHTTLDVASSQHTGNQRELEMDTPPADNELVHERLGKLSTIWSTLASVHEGSGTSESAGRLHFMQRFQRAAYRFLLDRLQNADVADELFQEGVLRFVRGDARDVGPQEVARARLPARDVSRALG